LSGTSSHAIAPSLPLRVSALFRDRLAADLEAFAPTHVVSLLDPDIRPVLRPGFPPHVALHQQLFHDREDDAPDTFTPDRAAAVIGFIDDCIAAHRAGDSMRLLIHCHMGASRSTATAYCALAQWHGAGEEVAAFGALLAITNKPWPNLKLVRLYDAALGRDGALVAPLEAYRRKHPRRIAAYSRLNARRGLAV